MQFDLQTVQPAANRYSIWAIPARVICECYYYYMCHEQMRTTAVGMLSLLQLA
jgi:hypothetical protein